jgi:hypothetical protein
MKKVLLVLMSGTLFWSCSQPKQEPVVAEPRPVDFADAKYTTIGRESLIKLAEGDVDAFLSNFADNAVFVWNNGDSISGKPAITSYWKDRRANAIDTITFKNEAWLPIQANEPPAHIATGVWLFNWSAFNVSYVNGKAISLNIHTVFHFDGSDKIDRVIQYLDRAPINAAMAAK